MAEKPDGLTKIFMGFSLGVAIFTGGIFTGRAIENRYKEPVKAVLSEDSNPRYVQITNRDKSQGYLFESKTDRFFEPNNTYETIVKDPDLEYKLLYQKD
jgi:hypothetical protein